MEKLKIPKIGKGVENFLKFKTDLQCKNCKHIFSINKKDRIYTRISKKWIRHEHTGHQLHTQIFRKIKVYYVECPKCGKDVDFGYKELDSEIYITERGCNIAELLG